MKHAWTMAVSGLAALASACSGGGGDSGHSSAGGFGAAAHGYQAYITLSPDFAETSLTLVNRDDFADRHEITGVRGVVGTLSGERSGDMLLGIGVKSSYYIRDGRWNRIDFRDGSIRQVSSESLTDSCTQPTIVEPMAGSEAGAVLFYSKAGADSTCLTDDDAHLKIGLADSASTAPQPGIRGNALHRFRSASGGLLGVLTADGGLKLYPPDFSTPIPLGPGELVTPVGPIRAGGLFLVDGEIRYIDAEGTVSDALHATDWLFSEWNVIEDGTWLYFQDGAVGGTSTLHRVRLDGTAASEVVLAGYEWLDLIGVTAASVVVAVHDAGGAAVVLLDRATGAYTSTLQQFESATIYPGAAQRAPLLYSTWDHATDSVVARRIDADDTLSSGPPDSIWAGHQYAVDWPVGALVGGSMPVAPPLIGAFRLTGYAPMAASPNVDVSLVDLSTGDGTLVVEDVTDEFVWLYAVGDHGMGVLAGSTGADTWQYDVFSFDLADHRVLRHTDGTEAYEIPYSF